MLKTILLAASFAVAFGFANSATAQTYYDRSGCGPAGCAPESYGGGGDVDGGLGRPCPRGYYPHAWPSGNGVRCEAPDGSWRF